MSDQVSSHAEDRHRLETRRPEDRTGVDLLQDVVDEALADLLSAAGVDTEGRSSTESGDFVDGGSVGADKTAMVGLKRREADGRSDEEL